MSEPDAMRSAITRLEVYVENLTKEVHNLRNDVQKSQAPSLIETRTKLQTFEAKLDEIAADVKESSKPKWGLYISFALLLWTVGGGIGLGFYNHQNNQIAAKVDQAVWEEWKIAAERRAAERDRIIQELRNSRR